MSENRNASEICRFCECCFKVKFGNISQPGKQGHLSSENLFKPSHRKDCRGVILADLCQAVGIALTKDPNTSERVCNPCGRKIRNLHSLYEFVSRGAAMNTGTPNKSNGGKRALGTPGSPAWRRQKQARVKSPGNERSKRSLAFGNPSTTAKQDEFQSALNINDLPNAGGLQVKVVILANGNVTVRIPRVYDEKQLIKHIAQKNWKAASNVLFQHQEMSTELRDGFRKAVSREFDQYLSESMLQSTDPDELAAFSNKVFMEEVRIFCPFWFHSVLGVSGLAAETMKEPGRNVNAASISTASLARVRNSAASAVHYRISTVLFHSGTKHEDLISLNRLGVCMSPNAIVRLQRKMGSQLESKVHVWKKTIADNRMALQLCNEIKCKQVPVMGTAQQIDVSEETLKDYESFTPRAYEVMKGVLADKAGNIEQALQEVIRDLQTAKLPFYK